MTVRLGRLGKVALAAGVTVALMTGCGVLGADPAPAAPQAAGPATSYAGVAFLDDLDFGAPDGTRLDVCLPEEHRAAQAARPENPGAQALPAILSVHGGGWRRGDKQAALWRDVCGWLASEGFVVFQTNYRLAPEHPYPAALDDVQAAARWIRAAPQLARFGLDPARLGAFGDSAGGNLAALLATQGDGDTTIDSRVSAVVALSAPIDLTAAGIELGGLEPGFQRIQLDYLGCASYDECPNAESASPLYQIDSSDPPFFIAHSSDELIPIEQAEAFVDALDAASVDVTYVPVTGTDHALALLDNPLREQIAAWLRDRLRARP
ncbi:alpha/beta hydrolase [Salinibacterium sp. ZJ450]|uniref:alpha/beta hydrolase n=1 Tax=Salinibacterium sp. ZJ450 TaxID=2708338 RepID=UPI001423DBB5|nr:alpha/beta hydrolase [Salinibacterium sp. ZJ450]